ncbi:hypothetical protein [Glycomyces niveus]|uniref:Cell division protein CrgA n=1 Tax=Glycomyces niveus TaxID=2820287 RepID=A0ABS3UAB4_9ACTN|nr:hypothetical protein [Glycomyces sp. NEAU-S30]MBO3735712.1 hypothetical protein [Glycomyces sp. NEAU-S30]
MGSTPPARKRIRMAPVPMTGLVHHIPKVPAAMARFVPPPPVPFAGATALPPIPIGYILLLLAMVVGVLALHTQGATYRQAVAIVDALLVTLGFFAWKQNK